MTVTHYGDFAAQLIWCYAASPAGSAAREPHSFAFYSTPARTPRPAIAENAFEDVNTLIRRHLPTKTSPIDPSLIKQVPFEAK